MDRTRTPDQEEAAINQERMADLEIEREEVKGQRHNTTETAPLPRSYRRIVYHLMIVLYVISSIHTFNPSSCLS